MNELFKLFDSLTEKIPLTVILYIRMVAIFSWFLAAIVAVYISWGEGSQSAPASGQDIYLSEIKEKATMENKLKNPPPLSVPELRDLKPEGGRSELPDFQDVVPEKKSENTLPPYISEKQNPDDTGAFLPSVGEDPEMRRNYKPENLNIDKSPADSTTIGTDKKRSLLPP